MTRNVRVLWSCVTLAASTLVLPALSGTALGQAPIRKVEQPSRLTIIHPAPPAACKLLDDPRARQLMDGLLFNLIWSCGRQHELGNLMGEVEVESESSEDQLRLITEAATAGDVRVNNPSGQSGNSVTQSETSISHNPVTGTLCSSFNDSGEFYGGGGGFTGFARSVDGGASWQDNGAVGGISGGDPSLIWRRADGYFYLGTLASGGNLALWVSTDDCQTFHQVGTPSTGNDDKELLAVDNNPSSLYYGNIYLVWNDFGLSGSGTIRAIRSTDGGSTWSTPVTLSSGGTVQGPWPAVAPNGDLFVAWIQYASWPSGNITVQMKRSTDGGLSFSSITSPLSNAVSPRDATSSSSCGRPALRGNLRYLASPQITVDANGVLHVVYSYDSDGYNTGDVVNVYYRRSTNSGSTWSTQVKLNDDATTRDQFFPTIQAQGSTLMATWYDRRNDSNNLKIDYYKRISNDGGVTWQPSQRLTDLSSSVVASAGTATCYHGDYDQSIVLPNRTEVAQWSDDRTGNADVYTDAASDIAACVVDVSTGTSNCSGAISYTGGLATLNLSGGFVRLDAIVDVCNPTGMVAHIADSPTSDGFGGDGFTAVHNAEAQLFDTSYMFFGMDDVDRFITDPVSLEQNTVPASGCYKVHFVILEDQVLFDDDGVTTDPFKVRLDSYRGFEVGPYNETDGEDPTGANANLWYATFNRTVSYRADRVGTGASRACLVLSRTTAPDPNLISSLCQ